VNNLRLQAAARSIKSGGIVAYPTEAVFGLGCSPFNEGAVRRLLILKRRTARKGLVVIAAYLEQLIPLLEPLTPLDYSILSDTWPGPYTWLIPARNTAPSWLRGQHDTLAVRVTAHPLAAALCRICGHPLVSTSANISKRPPTSSVLAVRKLFRNSIDYLLPGSIGHLQRPTEIRDLRTNIIVRNA
jgi:L-threonylcarbamoyladenylate synthase